MEIVIERTEKINIDDKYKDITQKYMTARYIMSTYKNSLPVELKWNSSNYVSLENQFYESVGIEWGMNLVGIADEDIPSEEVKQQVFNYITKERINKDSDSVIIGGILDYNFKNKGEK